MITKDTAYITENGQVVNTTITRPLSSRFDFLNTRIIAIYPDTTCWVNDFTNSYNEPYLRNYFSHPAYNAHPVVGVSWEQAVAFCHWRTAYLNAALSVRRTKSHWNTACPTEAEWEYAARGKQKGREISLGKVIRPMQNAVVIMPTSNRQKVDTPTTGTSSPAKVASYPSNEYGLYDMAGNVAEWTSSTWSESAYEDIE